MDDIDYRDYGIMYNGVLYATEEEIWEVIDNE